MRIDGSSVLVTGGAGLIGSHLVDELLLKNCKVTILDNLDPHTHPYGKPDWIPVKAKFIHGDVRNAEELEQAMEGCDFIFHQAAFGGFTEEVALYVDTNSTSTARIFEIIVKKKMPVKKVIVASSQAIYGEGLYQCSQHGEITPPMRSREQLSRRVWQHLCPHCRLPLKPLRVPENKTAACETIYGVSKFAQERITIGLGKRFGIPTVAMRYAVTYGPRQSIHNPYTGIVSIFSTQLLNDRPPVVFEDGNQTRDMLYVKDNVRANIFLAEKENACWEAYNVATGTPVPVLDVVEQLAEKYRKNVSPSIPGEFRVGDVRDFVHDPQRLNALGWKSEVSLSRGLDEYIDWIRTQGKVTDHFSRTHQRMYENKLVSRPIS